MDHSMETAWKMYSGMMQGFVEVGSALALVFQPPKSGPSHCHMTCIDGPYPNCIGLGVPDSRSSDCMSRFAHKQGPPRTY